MEEVVGAKVVVLILLGLIKLGSGLLPLLLDKVLQRKKVSLSFFLQLGICYFVTQIVLTYCKKKNVLVIEKKLLRSLEQSIQTVKGQNNIWKQNAFLTCSWRFLISNKLEQLEFKLEKIIGI